MAFMTCSSPESVTFRERVFAGPVPAPAGGRELHDPRAFRGRATPAAGARRPYGASYFR
jgi:hypothetical protein